MPKTYRIGDLAEQYAVSVEAVRYFERAGLMTAPQRSEGNYRLYTEAHRERLAFIVNCRALDMSHAEIRELLRVQDHPEDDCGDVNALVDRHLGHVRARVRALKGLERELLRLRSRCDETQAAKACGILQELTHSRISGGASARTCADDK